MILRILIYTIAGLALFFLYVRYLELTSIFYPDPEIKATPELIGLTYENVFLTAQDNVKIHGWYIPHDKAYASVIYFHGNGGNISDRLDKISVLHNLGLNIFICDYRGYGKSEGKPTETGIYRDALAAYDYLAQRRDIKKNDIIGYGASLGGAVIIDLAAKRDLKVLIIDSTFTSAKDMARRIYPFVPSFMVMIKLDSARKIKNLPMPKLFFHSQDDEMVPIALGQKLFELAPEPKKFVTISGGHNEAHLESHEQYVAALADFLREHKIIP
jgi:uncharacterized protein